MLRAHTCVTRCGSISVEALKASRFLIEASRSLPYRDEQGHVSLSLLRHSAAQVHSGQVTPPAEITAKLHKWLRAAERACPQAHAPAEAAAASATAVGSTGKREAGDMAIDNTLATAEKKRRREAADETTRGCA